MLIKAMLLQICKTKLTSGITQNGRLCYFRRMNYATVANLKKDKTPRFKIKKTRLKSQCKKEKLTTKGTKLFFTSIAINFL
jgi:hypothetical protein